MTSSVPDTGQGHLADPDAFAREFLERLRYGQGVDLHRATPNDCYMALARTVRQALMERWIETLNRQLSRQAKFVSYLSAEYLLGRQLENSLLAADLEDTAREAMDSLGLSLDELRDLEVEPGLGNGGLGRLAACFMDSLATMRIPAPKLSAIVSESVSCPKSRPRVYCTLFVISTPDFLRTKLAKCSACVCTNSP